MIPVSLTCLMNCLKHGNSYRHAKFIGQPLRIASSDCLECFLFLLPLVPVVWHHGHVVSELVLNADNEASQVVITARPRLRLSHGREGGAGQRSPPALVYYL